MKRKVILLFIAGILFFLAAAMTMFQKDSVGTGVVWLVLGVTFVILARRESKKTK